MMEQVPSLEDGYVISQQVGRSDGFSAGHSAAPSVDHPVDQTVIRSVSRTAIPSDDQTVTQPVGILLARRLFKRLVQVSTRLC